MTETGKIILSAITRTQMDKHCMSFHMRILLSALLAIIIFSWEFQTYIQNMINPFPSSDFPSFPSQHNCLWTLYPFFLKKNNLQSSLAFPICTWVWICTGHSLEHRKSTSDHTDRKRMFPQQLSTAIALQLGVESGKLSVIIKHGVPGKVWRPNMGLP